MRETIDLGDSKVTLVGTAHVSEESVEDVSDAINEVSPDLVAAELDEDRYSSLKNESGWKEMKTAEAIRDGKASLLLFNLLLSVYQRKIGMEKGVKPGAEMLEAVETAEEEGIEYALIDREIQETISRLRSELSFFQKYMLAASFLLEKFDGEDLNTEDLKQEDVMDQLVSEFEDRFPELKQVLLDERNSYMVERLKEREFDHAVVVVGAAHLDGMKEQLESGAKSYSASKKTSRLPLSTIAKYGFPAFIVLGIGYSFYRIGFSTGVEATSFWILSNGILAMLGAVVARSHPLTWLVSFVAAPLTSLDPALGAGMVASYFEAKFYPPKVGELEEIAYIQSYRQLWGNQVGRILLTFLLVSAGSAVATFVSAGYIFSLIS